MPAVPNTSTSTPAPVLQSGNYWVSTVKDGTGAQFNLSRSPAEDRSLLPKPILVLPKSVTRVPWKITRNSDGTYTLENNGAQVVNIKGQLFAQLQAQPSVETRWRITSAHWQGQDQFIIESVDRTAGWSLRTTEAGTVFSFVQPEIKPLVSTRSIPPQYQPSTRFIIKKI
ncbi:uncharacterized protein DFL_000760 [Arthrobotrys flagrans]|uniref:Ricin B lectin domain-containing protein n=1 Tax=Arthrobotrys flagrans TaxID=97331 RepID=A0A437AFH9_ARTFL|nr:hypothetical protein DFL_000760 [Arthrobotrys flagrans]